MPLFFKYNNIAKYYCLLLVLSQYTNKMKHLWWRLLTCKYRSQKSVAMPRGKWLSRLQEMKLLLALVSPFSSMTPGQEHHHCHHWLWEKRALLAFSSSSASLSSNDNSTFGIGDPWVTWQARVASDPDTTLTFMMMMKMIMTKMMVVMTMKMKNWRIFKTPLSA